MRITAPTLPSSLFNSPSHEGSPRPRRMAMRWLLAASIAALGGCGGDSSDSVLFTSNSNWQSGVFQPASEFANQCANPRSGIDPATGSPYLDVQGRGIDERNFLRSWSNHTYLWYDEIIDRDPTDYTTADYFGLLRTDARTESGRPKDNYHFYMPTAEYRALSQSGAAVGYGATFSILQRSPPREIVVAYVEPGSPAAAAGLARGDRIIEVDGVDFVEGSDVDTINAGLFPEESGEQHDFRILRLDDSEYDVSLEAGTITSSPVLEVATLAGGEVGYILFNDHIATAEQALVDAIEELQGVQDLVLDLRYNGGGLLDIAGQLAYMIAGPVRTNNAAFENLSFNDKHPTTNPVTGQALQPTPFHDTTLGFSLSAGQALPSLNLPRVLVLTSADTCSASESIINGLRGVDVEVIQIGTTTCGKPYGFYPQNNCGTTYFSIQFKGTNEKGFGDYADGFSPQDAVGGEQLPGCEVGDDFAHALGDPQEARLATALRYRSSPDTACTEVASSMNSKMGASLAAPASMSAIDGQILKSPALQGRIKER